MWVLRLYKKWTENIGELVIQIYVEVRMIFDTLNNSGLYCGQDPRFNDAFRFLRENDLSRLPAGRIDLDGDALYVLVQEYTTKTLEQGKWEAHRRYIDIQYIHSGAENMGFANLQAMDVGEYVPERDFLALSGEGNMVTVFAGAFVVFFPQDGHMPGLCVGKPGPVKKVVLKVQLDR